MGLSYRRLRNQEIVGTGRVRSNRFSSLRDSDRIPLFRVPRLPGSTCQRSQGERVRRQSIDLLLDDTILILRGRMTCNMELLIWNELDIANFLWGRSISDGFFHHTHPLIIHWDPVQALYLYIREYTVKFLRWALYS